MIPRILIVIPVYNNPLTIHNLVASCLAQSELPVLVVDDGSDQPVSSALEDLRSTSPERLEILSSPKNRGKGAALKQAFHYGVNHGYTHCLTLDADGQHQAKDILLLEKASWKHPWYLIIGCRSFNSQGVPELSKFGRKFSNFWIWYETGVSLGDSQSGMRVYPLFFLQNSKFFTNHFDFEVEVLTRILWNGAKVSEVAIDDVYPEQEQRISHFHKFRDNVRISLLNIFLVIVSLFRRHLSPSKIVLSILWGSMLAWFVASPMLALIILALVTSLSQLNGFVVLLSFGFAHVIIHYEILKILGSLTGQPPGFIALLISLATAICAGHASYIAHKKARFAWTAKMRGGRFGNYFLRKVSQNLGLAATYICLVFITPYFYVFAPRGKRASLEYLKNSQPRMNWLCRHFNVMRHFFVFGKILLDRLFQSQTTPDAFSLEITGRHHVANVFNSGKGAIMLSAHVGGWDLSTRAMLLEFMQERVQVAEHHVQGSDSVDATIRKGDSIKQNRIVVNDGQMPILHYRNLLESGQIVAIMGDRPLSEKLALVRFFNKLAPFDLTPFRIAASCQAPVIFCFAFKTGFKSYKITLDDPIYIEFPKGCDRDELSRQYAQEFASRLETELRLHPYQWFNFFPFFSRKPTPLPTFEPV